MALKTNITVTGIASITSDGFYAKTKSSVSEEVYVKVEKIDADKRAGTAYVTFSGAEVTGQRAYEFSINLSGENFIAQAYAHLKTLPEFADAVDC